MQFSEFRDMLISNFKEMTKDVTHLFVTDVDKDKLWETYLDSFPAGTNEIYRERRYYDCQCCKQFIRAIGNIAIIKDNKVSTLWDFNTNDSTFQPVIDALSALVKSSNIIDVYVNDSPVIGTEMNFAKEDDNVVKYEHFYLNMPEKFVTKSRNLSELRGNYRDTYNVFKRALEEFDTDSLLTVNELIDSNSLYKGEEWSYAIKLFIGYKKEYDKLDNDKKLLYAWEKSVSVNEAVGRLRNHSMGTLLIDLSNGMELDKAVQRYEKIVAPTNYKRPKAIFTKRMLEDAQNTINEMGYMSALPRRFATLDDITINNILFANRDTIKVLAKSEDVFAELSKEVSNKPRKFSKLETLSLEKFIQNILPTAKDIEVYLDNKHTNNFVSLIAPQDKNSKTMFKWNNNFSWAYSGNVTDSIKERVKTAGGRVDGVLRFSIQWDENGDDNSDLDAHCKEPDGNEIYYLNCRYPSASKTTGQLDVDVTQPNGGVAVENITWDNISKMQTGDYRFFVHNYANRGSKGFKAEIEFNGEIHYFEYNKPLKAKENVNVAVVKLNKDGTFTISEKLPSSVSSKEVWNLHTNEFIPVQTIMYSPNYWDEQQGIGHRHIFFMLKGCINSETPNGFYNEFLKEDLLKHKRVFEALASKMCVENTENQLSGIGFSTTKRDDLIVKIKSNNVERIIKVEI